MLIKLTMSSNKQDFYIQANSVRTIERNPKNLLETIVSTNVLTPQGFITYMVIESPTAVANAVAEALRSGMPATPTIIH